MADAPKPSDKDAVAPVQGQAPAPAAGTPSSEADLAGFKSQDDLVKSYKELRGRFTQLAQQIAEGKVAPKVQDKAPEVNPLDLVEKLMAEEEGSDSESDDADDDKPKRGRTSRNELKREIATVLAKGLAPLYADIAKKQQAEKAAQIAAILPEWKEFLPEITEAHNSGQDPLVVARSIRKAIDLSSKGAPAAPGVTTPAPAGMGFDRPGQGTLPAGGVTPKPPEKSQEEKEADAILEAATKSRRALRGL